MAGYDGRGAKFPLTIPRGSDVAFTVTATDDADAAIDLSGATITATIYDVDGDVAVTMTDAVSGAGSNVITLSLTDAQTTALAATRYRWTLWVSRGGDIRPWLAGDVNMVASSSGRTSNGADATLVVDTDVNIAVSVAAVGGSGGGGSMTAAEILTELKTVDGAGSGLDADLLDGNSAAAFATAAHNHTGTYQPLDADLTALAAAGNSTVLAATTASFLTADETKLDGIEAAADVTDTANVTAAGALMDSEVTSLAAIKNLVVPSATTISAYGATLVDDADAATARTTLGLGALAPKSAVAVPGDITATGTPSASTFLRGDGAWASPAGGGGGDLLAANNLSDVANAATSLSNLGGQPLDADLTALAAAGNSTVLAATTASFLLADETKLDGIEAAADVTDTANVTAAGALMDSEVTSLAAIKNLVVPSATTISTFGASLIDDAAASNARTTLGLGNAATLTVDADLATLSLPASTTISTFGASLVDDANAAAAITTLGLDADIATLVLPASTTISAFGATLVDDADNTAARTTLGLGTAATTAATAYATAAQGTTADAALPRVAGGAAVENIGAVEWNVNTVATSGATETLDVSVYGTHDVTMDQACTFTFSNPAPSGKESEFKLILRGAFTPTFPASVDWSDATPPTYTTPSVYVFSTIDGGTVWIGSQVAKAVG